MKAETFQDPASQMKRALFRPIAVGFVVTVLCLTCAVSCEASFLWSALGQEPRIEKERRREEHREWEKKLLQEDKSAQALLDALVAERKVYLDGLLEPLLGSYAMRARELLDPFARDLDLQLVFDNYAELPVRLLPLPPQPSPQLYARKPIRLTCKGSYAAIVSFILRVEEKMPLVALESFSFKVQKDPDNQLATIVLEWPINGKGAPTRLESVDDLHDVCERARLRLYKIARVQAELDQLTMYKNGRRTYGRLLAKIPEVVPEGVQLLALEIPEPKPQNLLPPGAKPGPNVKPLLGPTGMVENVSLRIMGRTAHDGPVKELMKALKSPAFADSLVAAQKGADVEASRHARSWPDTSPEVRDLGFLAFEIEYRCVERRFEK